jgi:antitoxin FitA
VFATAPLVVVWRPLSSTPGRSMLALLASLTDVGGPILANITVRNLDDEVQRRLKKRATEHGRSMEAEVRSILTAALAQGGLAQAWVEATENLRGDEIPLPERSVPRQVDLG